MFGSAVLETVFGVAALHTALSLVCSGITQYFSDWRRLRGRVLVGMLGDLLNHKGKRSALLAALLEDARVSGRGFATRPRGSRGGQELPAGGRIDKTVFAGSLLDQVAARASQGSAPVDEAALHLVRRLRATLAAVQAGATLALSGMELGRWDWLLKDIKARVDGLTGLPLDVVRPRAEEILRELAIAAAAVGQPEPRARLTEAVNQESAAVLELARRLLLPRALSLTAEELPESSFRKFLLGLAGRGELEEEEASQALQDWYASVNEKVSLAYRTRARRVLFLTALGLTLFLNADSLKVANRLARGEAVQVLVDDLSTSLSGRISTASAGSPGAWRGVDLLKSKLDELSMPLRWTSDDVEKLMGITDICHPARFGAGVYKVVGLLITPLALMMGAEFWYNLIKQFVSKRSKIT